MSGWRDIASAPRDGTEVLVYGLFAGEIHGPDDRPEFGIASYSNGRGDYSALGFTWDAVGGDAYAVWAKPTHWQPLPAPPIPTTQETGE